MKVNFLATFSISWLRSDLDYIFPSTGGKSGGSKRKQQTCYSYRSIWCYVDDYWLLRTVSIIRIVYAVRAVKR